MKEIEINRGKIEGIKKEVKETMKIRNLLGLIVVEFVLVFGVNVFAEEPSQYITVTGEVTGEGNIPIEGAFVTAAGFMINTTTNKVESLFSPSSTYTNQNGSYTLTMWVDYEKYLEVEKPLEMNLGVKVKKDGYEDQFRPIGEYTPGETKTINFVLGEEGKEGKGARESGGNAGGELKAVAYVREGQKDITVKVGQEVQFYGDKSIPPKGYELSDLQFQWDFGDGESSTDKNPMHTYSKAGDYNVILVVSAGEGTTPATDSVNVTISGVPVNEIWVQGKAPQPATDTCKEGDTRWDWTMLCERCVKYTYDGEGKWDGGGGRCAGYMTSPPSYSTKEECENAHKNNEGNNQQVNKQNGENCNNYSECQSGYCDGGVCRSKPAILCKNTGGTWNDGVDYCSCPEGKKFNRDEGCVKQTNSIPVPKPTEKPEIIIKGIKGIPSQPELNKYYYASIEYTKPQNSPTTHLTTTVTWSGDFSVIFAMGANAKSLTNTFERGLDDLVRIKFTKTGHHTITAKITSSVFRFNLTKVSKTVYIPDKCKGYPKSYCAGNSLIFESCYNGKTYKDTIPCNYGCGKNDKGEAVCKPAPRPSTCVEGKISNDGNKICCNGRWDGPRGIIRCPAKLVCKDGKAHWQCLSLSSTPPPKDECKTGSYSTESECKENCNNGTCEVIPPYSAPDYNSTVTYKCNCR